MKTKAIILMICCFFLYNCGSKCGGYAPENVKISWTEYNTERAVNKYFKYPKTAALHKNDTVLICGYILGEDDTGYYRSLYEKPVRFLNDDGEEMCIVVVDITDDPDDRFDGRAHPGRHYSQIFGSLEQMEWLKNYKAGTKIFAKVFCAASDPMDDSGCTWLIKMHAISFSTEV